MSLQLLPQGTVKRAVETREVRPLQEGKARLAAAKPPRAALEARPGQ